MKPAAHSNKGTDVAKYAKKVSSTMLCTSLINWRRYSWSPEPSEHTESRRVRRWLMTLEIKAGRHVQEDWRLKVEARRCIIGGGTWVGLKGTQCVIVTEEGIAWSLRSRHSLKAKWKDLVSDKEELHSCRLRVELWIGQRDFGTKGGG